MTNNEILKADLLDLIFYNRNQQYGAYLLRRTYPQRMLIALALTALLVLGVVGLLPATENQVYTASDPEPVQISFVDMTPPPAEPPAPVEPAPPPAAEPLAQAHYTDLINIVPDETVGADVVPPVAELAEKVVGVYQADGAPATGIAQLQSNASGARAETGEPPTEPEVYDFAAVEQMATFPGGMGAFQRYLGRHLSGAAGLEPGEHKTIKAKFVIGKDGSVIDIVVLQSGGADLDALLVKVLKRTPRWQPALQNGRPVAVAYVQAVSFVGGSE